MIGRLHHVVLDCPDPAALATFYSELLGWPVTYTSDDFVVVAPSGQHSGVAFQLAPDHVPPVWGIPAVRSRCTSTSWSTTGPAPQSRCSPSAAAC